MATWDVRGTDRQTGQFASAIVRAGAEADAVKEAGKTILIESIRKLPDLKPAAARVDPPTPEPVAAELPARAIAQSPAVAAPVLPYSIPPTIFDRLMARPGLKWGSIGAIATLAVIGVLAIFGVFRTEKPP